MILFRCFPRDSTSSPFFCKLIQPHRAVTICQGFYVLSSDRIPVSCFLFFSNDWSSSPSWFGGFGPSQASTFRRGEPRAWCEAANLITRILRRFCTQNFKHVCFRNRTMNVFFFVWAHGWLRGAIAFYLLCLSILALCGPASFSDSNDDKVNQLFTGCLRGKMTHKIRNS